MRAEIVSPPTSVATVELQVTPNLVPRVSSVKANISLFAVTAVVFTTIELETAFVGSATLPAAADAHTAGEADELQFVAVLKVFVTCKQPTSTLLKFACTQCSDESHHSTSTPDAGPTLGIVPSVPTAANPVPAVALGGDVPVLTVLVVTIGSVVLTVVPLSVTLEFVGQAPAPPPFGSTLTVSAPEDASVPVAV